MAASSRARRASGRAEDVGEVGALLGWCGIDARLGGAADRERSAPVGRDVPREDVGQRRGAVHPHLVDERGLGDVLDRHDDVTDPAPGGLEHRRQNTPHPAQRPLERQRAEVDDLLEELARTTPAAVRTTKAVGGSNSGLRHPISSPATPPVSPSARAPPPGGAGMQC